MIKENGSGILLFGLLVLVSCSLVPMSFSAYYDNTTVTAQLNITNTEPIVSNVDIGDFNATGNYLTLLDGGTRAVWCNATVFDYNGVPGDIDNVSAVIYHITDSSSGGSDDENYHYSNGSCQNITVINSTASIYACTFNVWYYANNGTWQCNMTAMDDDGINASNFDSSAPYLEELFALDVNNTLDFGELSTGTTSSDVGFNITNTGNQHINVSVDGFGVTDGDGLAMNCDVGTIGVSLERYSLSSGTAYASMTPLSDDPSQIPGLIVFQRTADVSYNTTFWKIQVPLGRQGWCNGTIIFSAAI